MPGIETLRLFIAVDLPERVKKILSACEKELEKSGADAKWIKSENVHLTIKFLGHVPSETIKNITDILDNLLSGHEKFEVTLSELGCFPKIATPRIVWAGVEDKKQILKNIAFSVEEALTKCGFEKEKKEFQAHATLGRIRSHQNRIALMEKIIDANQHFKKEKFLIDNITLFESRLSPQGPAYSVVHQIKFK